MDDRLTRFAKLFKDRDNQSFSSITTGTVITSSPVKIRLNDVIILDLEQLVLAERVSTSLTIGDEVIIIPTVDEQFYFVIDKAVRL